VPPTTGSTSGRLLATMGLILAGCSSQATPLAPSATPTSPTPAPTSGPTLTLQPSLTSRPTQTATSSPTLPPCPMPDPSQPLASAMLTTEEIPADKLPGITDYFRPPFRAIDSTNSYCSGDCVGRTWHGQDDLNIVSLTLFRGSDPKEADAFIRQQYAQLPEPYPIDEWQDDVLRILAPPENSRIVQIGPPATHYLTTSYCNIALVLRLLYQPPPGAYDYNAHDNVSLLVALANIQLQKLSSAALLP
jgi:hypothetical protein